LKSGAGNGRIGVGYQERKPGDRPFDIDGRE
jgi:hypothetical protein